MGLNVIMTTFERIKNISKKHGYSIKELSRKAGLSENTIYSWQRKDPKIGSIEKVAKFLDVSVDYLLGKSSNGYNDSEKVADIDDLSQIMRFNGKEIPESQREIVLNILKELNDGKNNK